MKAASPLPFVLGAFAISAALAVWHRPYNVSFNPVGKDVVHVHRSHWVKPDGSMSLRWGWDAAYQEAGWCVEVGGVRHLVYRGDGETLMATADAWWHEN